MGYMRRILAFLRFAVLASRQAIRLRGDVIFATSTPLTIAIPAIVASLWTRRPYVFEVRDMWPDVPIAIGALRNPVAIRSARALESITYRRAARIVALAPGMGKDIAAKGVPDGKISIIPNGCDLDVFTEDAAAVKRIREEHPWLSDRPLILFAGTLGLVNGVSYLPRLASAVVARNPEVRFAVIGSGRDRDYVRQSAEDAGILNRSFFLLGALPKHELAAWMSASTFTIALFTGPRVIWKDAVQNKFFDSLAAGRPVACNFRGWQSEIAESEGVGIILPPDDVEEGAKLLLARLADHQWLSEARQKALALARGRFSRDRQADELLRLLENVISH
jgi:glycosyltransferase involved in cell wall biosynthesis